VGVAPYHVGITGGKADVSLWGGRRPRPGELTGPAGRGTQVKVDPETGTLIREGIPFIINPLDIHAVETALQLKDKYGSKSSL
jgi:hypothetical protein